MLLSALCILIMNHYYLMESESDELNSHLSIYVFLNKNVQDSDKVRADIDSLSLISIDEFVLSKEVYKRSVEKNPFLAEIAIPDASNAFQSYIVASPAQIPDEQYLKTLEEELYKIDGVDEMVFDREGFARYLNLSQNLQYYRLIIYIFSGIIALFFIIALILSFTDEDKSWKKFLISFAIYNAAAIVGFWGLWGVCQVIKYPFVVDQISSLIVIPFTSLLGIVLKE
jgi:cell division protein FtsX